MKGLGALSWADLVSCLCPAGGLAADGTGVRAADGHASAMADAGVGQPVRYVITAFPSAAALATHPPIDFAPRP